LGYFGKKTIPFWQKPFGGSFLLKNPPFPAHFTGGSRRAICAQWSGLGRRELLPPKGVIGLWVGRAKGGGGGQGNCFKDDFPVGRFGGPEKPNFLRSPGFFPQGGRGQVWVWGSRGGPGPRLTGQLLFGTFRIPLRSRRRSAGASPIGREGGGPGARPGGGRSFGAGEQRTGAFWFPSGASALRPAKKKKRPNLPAISRKFGGVRKRGGPGIISSTEKKLA